MGRSLTLPMIAAMQPDDLKKVNEYSFQVAVCRYAEAHGWKVHYIRKSGAMGTDGKWRGSGPRGFPDLVLAKMMPAHEYRPPRPKVLYRELKAEKGRLSDEQREWAEVLGTLWDCWRPRDARQIMDELDIGDTKEEL